MNKPMIISTMLYFGTMIVKVQFPNKNIYEYVLNDLDIARFNSVKYKLRWLMKNHQSKGKLI